MICAECNGKGERYYVIDGQRIFALCENCGGDGAEIVPDGEGTMGVTMRPDKEEKDVVGSLLELISELQRERDDLASRLDLLSMPQAATYEFQIGE